MYVDVLLVVWLYVGCSENPLKLSTRQQIIGMSGAGVVVCGCFGGEAGSYRWNGDVKKMSSQMAGYD
jgi:hypothetical protein